MFIQDSLYPILTFVGVMFSTKQALATSCHDQVYPSEYAYHDDSVARAESASANCRSYPVIGGLPAGIHSTDYTHCDGTPLKLADTNLGSEQFSSSSYYQWNSGRNWQLLFIFPTRVSLTNITLHYYSDSVQGRPRLRFYVIGDNFDVWDTPTTTVPRVEVAAVPPGGEPTGRRIVSIDFNFNTTKVLMYKYSASFKFAVSEVDFLTCTVPTLSGTISTVVTENSTLSIIDSTSQVTNEVTESTTLAKDSTTMNTPSITMSTTPNFMTHNTKILKKSVTEIAAIIVSLVILVLSVALIITGVALIYKRKGAQKKFYIDSSYSILNRGTGQQMKSLQQDSAQLYDQIHLSPSTGQPEYVPKSETASVANQNQTSQNSCPTHSIAGVDIAEHSSAFNVGNQATTSQLPPQNAYDSTSEQPTYAAISTSKKKFKKQTEKEDPKYGAAKKGPPVFPYSAHEVPSASMQQTKENTTKQEINSPHTIEQLYTAVNKKPKVGEPKDEEETLPIPPLHTVEELYTAVQKKPNSRFNTKSEDEAPQPHTAEETQTDGEKPSQSAIEDLYTSVMKQPKDSSADDTQTAPPIPPHTVEELYTAVMKKPNSGTEDEEEAPPIPPYTATQ